MPANRVRSPQRRTLFCDPTGHTINWRQSVKTDYPSEVEYYADAGNIAYTESKDKVPISLGDLASVQYSKDKFEDKDNAEFFMRLVFEGHRTLDIKLRNKTDFEYCMDGFEAISKNRDLFKKKTSFRPDSLEEINAMEKYEPVTMQFAGKTWNVGCGNDWEDIFLILTCYGSLWSFLIAFYSLLLKGAIDSDEKNTLLYMYLTFGIIYVSLIGLGVVTGQAAQREQLKKKIKMGLSEDEELPIEDDE
jgi:hypothetical protein